MAEKTREIAFPIGTTEEGHPRLLRVRGDEIGPKEVARGTLAPLVKGEAIPPGAELVRLTSRGNYLDVDVLATGGSQKSGFGWKPMQVPREKFASNWDRIFGKKQDEPLPN